MQEDVSQLISVDEAIAIIDATPVAPRMARIRLAQAQGRVLAQDVAADRDYPPFDKSLMDGFALRADDATGDQVRLALTGEVAAGAPMRRPLDPGQTVRIMTGAALPAGADAVIPVEMLQRIDAAVAHLRGPAVAGKFIAARGSDCPAGRVVLRRGQALEAAQLAVAATVGAHELDCFARPRVAVLATGDEIVPFDSAPADGQIRNCNSIMLVSLLGRLGCDVTDAGTVRDDPRLIRDAIQRALDAHDVLVVTGGMSMGEYDYVPRVLIELGAELKITKLRIKPGKPFVLAMLSGADAPKAVSTAARYVFGLPGNPVSGFACTLRLCARLLARLGGRTIREKWTRAVLASDLPPNGPREFYQPARLGDDGSVRALEWKSSGDVFTLSEANCLLVRRENEPAQRAATSVRVLEIPV